MLGIKKKIEQKRRFFGSLIYLIYQPKRDDSRYYRQAIDRIKDRLVKKGYIFGSGQLSGHPTEKGIKCLNSVNIVVPQYKEVQEIYKRSKILKLWDSNGGDRYV